MTIKTHSSSAPGMLPHAGGIGEFQAALAANASMFSWLEAPNTQVSGVIAPGDAADGSCAVFTNQQST